MRSWWGAVLAGVAALVVGASPARAADLPLTVEEVETFDYPNLSVVVTPPRGGELPADAFAVTEDGERVKAEVDRVSGEELEVVLVIDTSGSMEGLPMAAAKIAAGAFVNRMPADVPISVVGFGPVPVVASPLTTDRALTHVSINNLAPAGETALFDAVTVALSQFSGAAARRSVVVLSDGADTVSAATPELVAERVVAAGARVDAAVLASPESDAAALDALARRGGGQMTTVAGPEALNGVYDAIATSLLSTYRLTWRSQADGATEVAVSVALGRDSAVARSTVDLPVRAGSSGRRVVPRPEPEPAPPVPTWALVTGSVAVFLALAVLGLVVLVRDGVVRRRTRLARLGTQVEESSLPGLGELAQRATAAADGALERRGRRAPLNAALERAGIALRPGEFLVLTGSAAVAAFLFGSLLGGLVVGAALVVIVALVAKGGLSLLDLRRRRAFSNQLADTLQLLAGSLRAGYGLLQAVDAVAREAPSPTGEEFRRVVLETRLGRDLTEALHDMAERVGTEDFAWVVQAIDIHREVGGDLAAILDTVAGTIRERNQLLRQVSALTAEGRLSAYILLALPFVLAGMLRVINPGYFSLLTHGPGLVMAGIGVVMLSAGALWFHKLCRFAV
jgi:tight adherence protein B